MARDDATEALRVVGVVLAAGASRRMGRPKAGLLLAERTFLAHAIAAQRAAGIAPVVVVAGADRAAVAAAIPEDQGGAVLLENPAPARGQLSSLKVALEHLLRDPTATAALVALVDHPTVTAATIRRIVAAAHDAHDAAIVLPKHAGRRGHPVLFRRRLWRDLLATPDELGARAVVRADPARVLEVEVDDPGVLLDVDTPADLRRLRGHGA